jgi:hypothetical protein
MTEKPEAIPLSSLFAVDIRPTPAFDPAKGGVVVDLAETSIKRMKFELRLPTAEPGLLQVVEDEIERYAVKGVELESVVVELETAIAESKQRYVTGGKKGGEISAHVRNGNTKERNDDIERQARNLLASGREAHEICGILAQQKGLGPKAIRNILQRAGVLEKRK